MDRLRRWACVGPPERPRWARAAELSLFAFAGIWAAYYDSPSHLVPAFAALVAIVWFAPSLVLEHPLLWHAAGWVSVALALTSTAVLPRVVQILVVMVAIRLAPSLVGARWGFLRAVGWIWAAGLFISIMGVLAVEVVFIAGFRWIVPNTTQALAAVLMALAVLGSLFTQMIRVPLVLPMVIFGVGLQEGIVREVSSVRCDDYLRVRAPVEIVVPVRRDLEGCRPGQSLPVGRYPRRVWEAPDGRRYLFTSQMPGWWWKGPQSVDVITGLVCETPSGGTKDPKCIGGAFGKSNCITEAAPLKKLFIGAYELPPDADGRRHSLVMTVPREGPLEPIEEHYIEGPAGGDSSVGADVIYQPAHDTLWLFGDLFSLRELRRASDFTLLERGSMFPTSLEFGFDQSTDEGLLCGIMHAPGTLIATVAAFTGSPPVQRYIVSSSSRRWPLLFGVPYGCAIASKDRRAYVSFINLGFVVGFDYDSGNIETIFPLGVGVRVLTYDAKRRLLYVGNFSSGEVVSIDVDSGIARQRWFVGRFPRDVQLTRNGDALLVATNIGLVRVALDRPTR